MELEGKAADRWLRHRFSAVGWALIAYYGLMNLLVTGAAAAELIRCRVSGDITALSPERILGNGWGYITAILSGGAILYGWKGPDFFHGLVRPRGRMTARAFCGLLILCLGAQMANSLWVIGLEAMMNALGKTVLDVLDQVAGATNSLSMFLYASILAPIGEEVLFRGLCMKTLEPFGKRFAILCSAVVFGVFHGNLLQAPYALVMGLVLGYVAAEYSLIWSVAVHMFNNLVLAQGLSMLMERMPIYSQNALSLLIFGFGAIGSVVLLVKNCGRIRAYRKDFLDRRCLKCFFTCGGVLTFLVLMAVSIALTL